MNTQFKIYQLVKSQKFICPQCEESFMLRGKKLTQYKQHKKRKESYKGPFCSPTCAAKYAYSRLNDYNHQLKLPYED